MKACIIQPPYSRDLSYSDEYFDYKMQLLSQCDQTLDLIVLPEYSDVPCATATKEETFYYHKKYINVLLDKCIETARRCGAIVCVNALYPVGDNYRNTTYVYDREGKLVGQYFKKHLPPDHPKSVKKTYSGSRSAARGGAILKFSSIILTAWGVQKITSRRGYTDSRATVCSIPRKDAYRQVSTRGEVC